MADTSQRAATPSGVAILSDAPLGALGRDYFGFRVYGEALASLIDNDLTETPLTIALSAPWGGGKTTVAQMVQRRLEERTASRNGTRPVLACRFDAWLHHDADHLGAALAGAVARTADSARPWWRRLLNPVPAAMLGPRQRWRRRAMLGVLAVVVATLVVLVGPWNDAATELLGVKNYNEDKLGAAGPLLTAVLLGLVVARSVFRAASDAAQFVDDPGSEAARGSMAQVRDQLGALIQQARRGGTLVIYVDDLERCPPERALEVCEVANQLLSHEGVVTLLVADMEAIAAAASDRYPDQGGEGVGHRFLEKIVQLQVALPPPHRLHLRRLLRGDDPDEAFTRPLEVSVLPSPPAASAFSALARMIASASYFVPLGVLLLVGLLGVPSAAGNALALLLAAPLLLVVIGRGYLFWRARQASAESRAIRELIRAGVTEQLAHEEIERRVLAGRRPRYEALALDLLESFRLDNTAELREVVEVILKYPPDLPRGAKRMLNHARLLTQIARERGIFGGNPELAPQHLGEWIVITERWPWLAREIAARPALMRDLEDARAADKPGVSGQSVDSVLKRSGLKVPAPDDLLDLLECEPRLGDVVARLVHFEPAGVASSADAEVLRVDHGS